ncbi:MAG TPA: SDR family oxidoreductase [Chitinophagaceae bacterium]|nr:SDR family oxidoreductase [Chitinophagaceae bacterium]
MGKWNLKGKKALITGGSKGIGKAVVSELLELGAEVVFSARNGEVVKQLLGQFKQQGYRVDGLTADVTSVDDRHRITKWIEGQWGKLDILVNNAGINIRKPSNEYISKEYQQVMETDLIAPFDLSRELFEVFKKSGKAAVVNVASVAGIMDAKTGAPYGMAKAGLIQLTRILACEWAEFQIRVNAVSPWFTQTPATEALLANSNKLQQIVSRTPIGRVARGEEIAAAIAFLVMDKASFITGQNIVVDGGATSSAL